MSSIVQSRVLLEVVLVSLGVWHPPQLQLQLQPETAKKRISSGRAIYTLTVVGAICILVYRACHDVNQLWVLCLYSMINMSGTKRRSNSEGKIEQRMNFRWWFTTMLAVNKECHICCGHKILLHSSYFLYPLQSEQHEKQQEIKRCRQGKEMSTFQQQQEEFRNQTWIQERKKQKEEERKAREEIKAKLEQDRLERRARQRASETTGKYH